MMIKKRKGMMAFLVITMMLLAVFLRSSQPEKRMISYSEFWEMAANGEIAAVTVNDLAEWEIRLQNGEWAKTPNPRSQDVKERLLSLDIYVVEEKTAQGNTFFMLLGVLGLCAVLLRSRKSGAMGLEKYAAIKAEEKIPDVTFSDIAVPKDTLESMHDLVSFLREPGRFSRCGARIPKGVILYGPPGTGKTLLAKALAGEARCPFFAMSGADFVQVYVGVGASRVRELFRKARKAGGGVIFIDEIDAIGKKRDNGNDEREQTLNALLTEMSGFSGSDGILVLAATNRLDTLDGALLREGRFDRRIEVGLPDYEDRLKILRVHSRKKPLDAGVSLEELAYKTTLFSGAQLDTLLNEAAIRAARREGECILPEDMEKAYCSMVAGDERRRGMTEEEKRITAFHEAGHALITRLLLPDARLMRVTVIPSSRGAAGYSMSVQKDKMLHTRKELIAMLAAVLGGRAAEEMIFGPENVTTGASGDLKKAKEMAHCMVKDWAMGESEEEIIREGMQRAFECLKKHEEKLRLLAEELIKKETLGEEEVRQLLV